MIPDSGSEEKKRYWLRRNRLPHVSQQRERESDIPFRQVFAAPLACSIMPVIRMAPVDALARASG
jgi:hypothetical protein